MSKIPFLGKVYAKGAGSPAWPRGTRYGNILSPKLVPENSCDLLFLSHVLEHLTRVGALRALKNCYNFLKPGGVVRIIVPDLESMTRDYIRRAEEGDSVASEKYITELGMSSPGMEDDWISRMRNIFGNSQHRWMYDKHSLLSLLSESGFLENRMSGVGDWSDERFSEIEEEGRHFHAICIESRKLQISGVGNSLR